MSYDQKCHDLAKAFLSDCDLTGYEAEWRAEELAQQIQALIEGYIYANNLNKPSKPAE